MHAMAADPGFAATLKTYTEKFGGQVAPSPATWAVWTALDLTGGGW